MNAALSTEFRVADLATFLAILRAGSVSGAARALDVTPSQVSKSVARLERDLGVRLLVRGSRGVEPTEHGTRLTPRFEAIIEAFRALRSPDEAAPELTVVASAWLSALFVPMIAVALPALRVRSLELPPGTASAWASEHRFDVALTTHHERWPDTWVRTRVGTLDRALFAAPSVARRLGPQSVSVESLRSVKFVMPVYGHQGQLFAGDDGCPLPRDRRLLGHQTESLAVALEIAARTDNVVFGPVRAACRFIAAGHLVKVAVEGWSVSEPMHVVCNGDRVRAPVQRKLIEALRDNLEAHEASVAKEG